jgi:Domain of Unknown Function with PDB structure (DUF3857)
MKKILTLYTIACLCFVSVIKAQQLNDWEASPKTHKVKPIFARESAVILSDLRVQEFVQEEKKGLMLIITNKRLVKVLDDNGVESYNKIYLPVYNNAQILSLKARTILPNGKIVNLPDNKILDAEEEGRAYKKFALEGVEKGSEIEYFYQIKKEASYFGLERFQSSNAPFEQANFVLITPDYLSFTVKGYNGFNVGKDSVADKKRIIKASCTDIETAVDEKYSSKDANAKNVQFKFSYNLSKDKSVRIFTWNELAKNVYNNYSTFNDKEGKAVEGFIKKMEIKESASEEEKIMHLENYIKTNINADKDGIGEDAEKLDKIVKNKVASNAGSNRLFIVCMEKLRINWQIVFPSKRDDIALDEDLENYRLVEDIIFYFPNTGHFLEPANVIMRYPFITAFWANTKGLFLEGTTIGKFKTALASFKDIPIQPMEESLRDMIISLKFNAKMDSILMHTKQIYNGYSAAEYRPIFAFTPADKLDDISKEILKSVGKSDNIKNVKLEGGTFLNDNSRKPLILEGDVTTADLIEVAGKKLLLKIGEVIGPQVQMYQEKERQLPLSMNYPNIQDRTISFVIPDGYVIKNLSDLEMNITDKASGKETMGFISTYKLTGNNLEIKLHEFYSTTDYPASYLEPFTRVINASADFNKVVLVLEKK